MPLIPCPACERQVSPQAVSCPQCGHPLMPSAVKQVIAPSTQVDSRPPSTIGRPSLPLTELQELALWHKVLLYSWVYWLLVSTLFWFSMITQATMLTMIALVLLPIYYVFNAAVHFKVMRICRWPLWVSIILIATPLIPPVSAIFSLGMLFMIGYQLHKSNVPMSWFGADLRRVP